MPESHVHVGDLTELKVVLGKWRDLMDAAQTWDTESYRDAPWWYNERASVSLLVGCVHSAGGFAMEEFVSPKKGLALNGRNDLWFETAGKQKFAAEAKQCWPSLLRVNEGIERLKQYRLAAIADAERLHLETDTTCLAITFAAPYLKVSAAASVEDKVEAFVTQLEGLIADAWKDDGVVWAFPPSHRTLTSSRTDDLYPGSVLIVTRVEA